MLQPTNEEATRILNEDGLNSAPALKLPRSKGNNDVESIICEPGNLRFDNLILIVGTEEFSEPTRCMGRLKATVDHIFSQVMQKSEILVAMPLFHSSFGPSWKERLAEEKIKQISTATRKYEKCMLAVIRIVVSCREEEKLLHRTLGVQQVVETPDL